MGRSSRILCFICLFGATPVLAQGHLMQVRPSFPHRPLMVRMPTNIAPRLAVRTGQPAMRNRLAMPQRLALLSAGRPGLSARGDRRGGFAFDGVGLGLSLVSDLAAPPISGEDAPPPEPEVIPGIAPPPCPRPLMIKIGLGMRHAAHTRVIYGTPTTCVP